METRYKVVRIHGYHYCSAILTPTRFGLGRIYKVDEWTEATPFALKRGYGLLVFDSLTSANDFIGMLGDKYLIFKCECEEELDLPRYRFVQVGEQTVHRLEYDLTGSWPYGSKMFKRIKLVK